MERYQLQSGLKVRSADGSYLGTVTQCDAESFTIGKAEGGRAGFFDADYRAGYDEILAYRDGEIYLTRHDAQLTRERRHTPAVGAAVPFALEEEREIETALEISTDTLHGDEPRRASR